MVLRLTFLQLLFLVSSLKVPLHRRYTPDRRLGSFGKTPLNNYSNVLFPQFQYYANITMGTPGQTLSAGFDTGSAWIAMPSVTCDSTCAAAVNFNASKSTSYMTTKMPKKLTYGSGSSTGTVGYETFSIGTQATVTATSVPFVLVTSETGNGNSKFQGLIVTATQGFGFSSLSSDFPTFMDTLKTQNVISQKVFSFYLSNDKFLQNGYDVSSVCVIGEVDLSYASGGVNYMSVYKPQGYWSVNLNSVSLGGNSVTLSNDIAVFDTGTSLLTIPATDMYSLFDALNKVGSCTISTSGYISCDCHKTYTISSYPALVIGLNQGASTYPLTPVDYFYDVRLIQDGQICQLLAQGSSSVPFWVLGDVFLNKYYTIYDMDNMKVGIASASGTTLLMAMAILLTSIVN